jgi:hypothetical protein
MSALLCGLVLDLHVLRLVYAKEPSMRACTKKSERSTTFGAPRSRSVEMNGTAGYRRHQQAEAVHVTTGRGEVCHTTTRLGFFG